MDSDLDSPIKRDLQVDLVGYPGHLSREKLLLHHNDIKGKDVDEAILAANQILPEGTLCVTTGHILENGINPTYRLSTTSGMSGGPVLLNGKVIGKRILCLK